MQELRNGLPEPIIVPNKLQPQYRLSRDLLAIVRSWDMPSGEGLHSRQAYADAIGQGTVVWRLPTPGARQAAGELQYFFQRLINNDPKAQKFDRSRGAAGAHA